MPITPTNVSKNTITPTENNKGGYVLWGDPVYTWGDAVGLWGSPYYAPTNVSKNSISPTNQTKN